jgi:hypothetical protein
MTESSSTPEASSTTSEADADNTTPTAAPDGASMAGIDDDQLPEDLRPTDDNPLAKPLDPEDEATKSPEELGMDDTQDDEEGDTDPEATADTGPDSRFDPEAPADTEAGAGGTTDDEESEDS